MRWMCVMEMLGGIRDSDLYGLDKDLGAYVLSLLFPSALHQQIKQAAGPQSRVLLSPCHGESKNRLANNGTSGGRPQMNCFRESSLGSVAGERRSTCLICYRTPGTGECCWDHRGLELWMKTSGTCNTMNTWLDLAFQPNSFTSWLKRNVFPCLSPLFSHYGPCALFCFIHLVVFVKMVNMRSISYYGMAAKGLSFMRLWLRGLAARCGFLGRIFAEPSANAKPEQVSSLPVCRVSLRSLRGISVSPTRGFPPSTAIFGT